MKSQQVKSLLSACNLLFLFIPCSALIDLPMLHFYCLFKVIVVKKAYLVICTFDIYSIHACRRPQLDGFKLC